MRKVENRILSFILSLGVLLSSVPAVVKAEIKSSEDFESYSSISEVKGSGKFISTNNNAELELCKEELGETTNQYLKASGTGVQAVTNEILPDGTSLISMRIKFSGNNQQLVLRSSKEALYLLNVDAVNKIRLLNDASKTLGLTEDTWYRFSMIADTDKKVVSATITNETTNETVSNTKTFSGDAANQLVEDAHLRFKINSGSVGIDDVVCNIPAQASFEQKGKILCVRPELTFVTNCDTPLTAENILINGESGYISTVVQEEEGRYRAFLARPLDKGTVYTVSLSNYKNAEGLETNFIPSEFQTRDSGLTMTKNGDVYIIKNELESEETAVAAGIFLDNGAVKEWDFERISLKGGKELEFSMPGADNVILMNNLTQRIPYEIFTTGDERYEHGENGGLLEFTYDEKSFTLRCAGISPEGEGRHIIAAVIGNSSSNTDLDSATKEEVKKAIVYIRGFITDAEGAYSFNTLSAFKTDRYKIKISGGSDTEKTESEEIPMTNPKDADDLCRSVNTAQSVKAVEDALTEYSYVLDVDFELLNNMEDKSFIYSYVFERKNEKPYTSAGAVSSDMRTAAVIYAINKANDEEAGRLVDVYSAQIGFEESSVYPMWTELDTNKASVIKKIHNREYSAAKDFLNMLEKYTLYAVIQTTQRYATVTQIIDDYYELLGISLTKYEKIGAQSYVAKQMINKEYDDTNFANAFNEYVDAYERQNSGKNTISSGTKDEILKLPTVSSENKEVELKPVEPTKTTQSFNDLDTVSWAKDAIIALNQAGIISGYSDGSFRPNQTITREEFVTLLVRCFDFKDSSAECDFEDVPEDAWFRQYVAYAKSSGITDGISAVQFGTGSYITRQDMCVMVYRAINKLNIEMERGEKKEFSDSDSIAPYAAEAVSALSEIGIISGLGNEFAPEKYSTRAEVARVLYEIYKINETEADLPNSGEKAVSEIEKGLVNALGMFVLEEEGDRVITRKEFAGEVAKLIGFGELATTTEEITEYDDVDRFTENGAAIVYLLKSNIMAGYKDNLFGPDDAINSHDAVSTVAKALGYGAELSDSEKIYQAAIGHGLPSMEDKELSYSDAVHLFYEALYCKTPRNSTTTTLSTPIECIFKIYEGIGTVTATEITSLDGSKVASSGSIRIDNREYISKDFSQYLGYRVKYYYREDSFGDYELVYVYPKDCKVLDIAAEEIEGFQSRKLTYKREEGKLKSVNIPLSADVIYNQEAFPNYGDEVFMPKAGNIRLIDTGNGYDTVFIEEYSSGVVTRISKEQDTLYFEGGSSLPIEDVDYLYIEDASAKAHTIEDIKEGMVVSYMISKGKKVIRLILSDATIEGTIQTVETDSKKVVTDGGEYRISPDFQPNMDILKVGTPLYMYLDYKGLIVMAKTGENQTYKLGYLIKTYPDEADDIYVRLLTQDNELQNLLCKNEINIDGKPVPCDTIKAELCSGGGSEAQLIRYKLDNTGKISWIETAVNRDNYTGLIADTADKQQLYIDTKTNSAMIFKSGINTFSGKCMVDDATAVFFVQTDTSRTDKLNFHSGNIGMLTNDKSYKFISYRTDSFGASVDAVVIIDDDNMDQIGSSTPLSVVTKVYQGLNEDDEAVTYISLIKQNKELAYELAKNVTITDAQGKSSYTQAGASIPYMPAEGDTIRYAINGEGKIAKIQIMVDCNRGILTSASNPNDNNYGGSQFHYILAKAYDYNEGVLSLCKSIEPQTMKKFDMEMYRQVSSVPITICEKIWGKIVVRTATAEDIKTYRQVKDECSTVLIVSRYGTPQSLVIYDSNVLN